MSSDAPRLATRGYRVIYVSPLHVGLLQLAVVVFVYVALCALSWRTWSIEQLAISAIGGFAGGGLVAILFDLVAPRFGGLKIDMIEEPAPHPAPVGSARPEAPADLLQSTPDPGTRKSCPQCQAQVRADRSFCPECDFTFDDARGSQTQ